MRVSVDQADAGYHPLACHCRVFLEGAERCNVVMADEERRHAVLHVLDEHGRPVVKGQRILTEDFYGAVRIQLPTDHDAASFERYREAWKKQIALLPPGTAAAAPPP